MHGGCSRKEVRVQGDSTHTNNVSSFPLNPHREPGVYILQRQQSVVTHDGITLKHIERDDFEHS